MLSCGCWGSADFAISVYLHCLNSLPFSMFLWDLLVQITLNASLHRRQVWRLTAILFASCHEEARYVSVKFTSDISKLSLTSRAASAGCEMWTLRWNSSYRHARSFRKPFHSVFNKTRPKWIHRKQLKCFYFLLSKFDSLRVRTCEFARKAASFIHECGCGVFTTHCPFSPSKQYIMQPKPEGYVDDFTAKCRHCDGIKVNGIHAHSGNFCTMFFKSKHNCIGCHGSEIPTCRYFKLGWNTTRLKPNTFQKLLSLYFLLPPVCTGNHAI